MKSDFDFSLGFAGGVERLKVVRIRRSHHGDGSFSAL